MVQEIENLVGKKKKWNIATWYKAAWFSINLGEHSFEKKNLWRFVIDTPINRFIELIFTEFLFMSASVLIAFICIFSLN